MRGGRRPRTPGALPGSLYRSTIVPALGTSALRTRGARERDSSAEHRPPNTHHGSIPGPLVWWHRGMDARLLRRSSLGGLVRGAALVVEEVAVGSASEGPRHRLVALLDKGVLDLAAARRSARVSGTRKDPWYSAIKAGGWGWVVAAARTCSYSWCPCELWRTKTKPMYRPTTGRKTNEIFFHLSVSAAHAKQQVRHRN